MFLYDQNVVSMCFQRKRSDASGREAIQCFFITFLLTSRLSVLELLATSCVACETHPTGEEASTKLTILWIEVSDELQREDPS